ncbi:hypothetical protein ACOMHN_036944 [Nucella lapillus]
MADHRQVIRWADGCVHWVELLKVACRMVQDLWMPKVNERERDDSFGQLLDMAKGQAGDNRRYVREHAKNWLREVAHLLYEMCIKPVEWIERHMGPVKVQKLKTVTGNWDPFADRPDIRLQDGVNFT